MLKILDNLNCTSDIVGSYSNYNDEIDEMYNNCNDNCDGNYDDDRDVSLLRILVSYIISYKNNSLTLVKSLLCLSEYNVVYLIRKFFI